MDTEYTFSSLDRLICGMVGCSRNASARAMGLRHEENRHNFGYEDDIAGSMGEFAVSQLLKMNWNPVLNQLDTVRGDLGRNIQVKTIADMARGMGVRKTDPIGHIYVLVYLTLTKAKLLGWCHGRYAKEKPLTVKVYKPAHWVEINELKPIEELPPLIDRGFSW